jgi:hypothetical protein
MDDLFSRSLGYIKAFADHRQNKQQIEITQKKNG